MKFRYMITDLHEGSVKGTNDEEKAIDLSQSEDYFVVDTKNCAWLSFGELCDIEEI
jgi:hypothetical protein